MFRKLPFLVALLMTGIFAIRDGLADDDDEYAASALHAANNIKWAQMTIRIVDHEGQPIVGAKVLPWALRYGNAHGWWNKETFGAPQETVTNENGQTDVVFPHSVTYFKREPVVQVSLFISHSDFCTKNAHVNVPGGNFPEAPTVTLEQGVRLRIAGVAPDSDRPLPHCHVMLENGESPTPEFTADADGWLQSIPIGINRRWFRVIHTPPGEPPQFSKPHAWNPDDPASRTVRVEVRPGIRVAGWISDDVPRPIERGWVVAWCGSPVRKDENNNLTLKQPIWWIDTAPIQKNGSFKFTSLPSGYLAQIYAFANDWISAQPSDEAYETCCKWFAVTNRQRQTFFRGGQMLRLAGAKAQITIEMERACQVRIKCVDPEGRPLRRIDVSSWPNQFMVGGGSTIFCRHHSSLDALNGQKEINWSSASIFTAKTDDSGEAIIRNLPAGKQGLVAGNEIWRSNREEVNVEASVDRITEVMVRLHKAPEVEPEPNEKGPVDEGLIDKVKQLLEKIPQK